MVHISIFRGLNSPRRFIVQIEALCWRITPSVSACRRVKRDRENTRYKCPTNKAYGDYSSTVNPVTDS